MLQWYSNWKKCMLLYTLDIYNACEKRLWYMQFHQNSPLKINFYIYIYKFMLHIYITMSFFHVKKRAMKNMNSWTKNSKHRFPAWYFCRCCMVYLHFNAQVCCMQDFSKKVWNAHFIAFSSKRQRRRNTSPNFICLRSGPQFAEKVFEMNFSEGLAKKKYITKIQIWGLIHDLLKKVPTDTVLILFNATYFENSWQGTYI